jgi:hypothetical protein
MPRAKVLAFFRVTHLYIGVFIAPALLFFAFTGALQTFGLHETNRDHPNYKPAHWIAVISQLHKKQTTVLPVRRVAPAAPAIAAGDAVGGTGKRGVGGDGLGGVKPSEAGRAAASVPSSPSAAAPSRHPLPLRLFFLVVCVGLFVSTLTGLTMSYSYHRNKRLVTGVLIAGVIVPLVLIFV